MSTFSWITWIAPDNATLDTVCGFYGGLGLNPWPTFDWNNLTAWLTPLTIPTFAIMNMFVGILIGAVMRVLFRPESGLPINLRRRSLAVYYTNSWNTSYLRINSNKAWDNTGHHYKVTAILNDKNLLDENLYQAYSEPWMPAGFIMSNVWYFAIYAASKLSFGLQLERC